MICIVLGLEPASNGYFSQTAEAAATAAKLGDTITDEAVQNNKQILHEINRASPRLCSEAYWAYERLQKSQALIESRR